MTHHTVRVRRIYDHPVADDGIRVLVDRVWTLCQLDPTRQDSRKATDRALLGARLQMIPTEGAQLNGAARSYSPRTSVSNYYYM